MSETFRLWRHGAPLAVLGDERALRLCLPILGETELARLERNLRASRLLATPLSVSHPPVFGIGVRDELWLCRRDARR